MANRERTSGNDSVAAQVANCSSPAEIKKAISLTVKRSAQLEADLMDLAEEIRRLERPEMSEKARKVGWEKVEEAMDSHPTKFPPKLPQP
jgi:hypothetical protein